MRKLWGPQRCQCSWQSRSRVQYVRPNRLCETADGTDGGECDARRCDEGARKTECCGCRDHHGSTRKGVGVSSTASASQAECPAQLGGRVVVPLAGGGKQTETHR